MIKHFRSMQRPDCSNRIWWVFCVVMLSAHSLLLAWQGYRSSPTVDEPAHLASGLSHWKFNHFDLYRVNPPFIRMVASLPMLVLSPQSDWGTFTDAPYSRPEFPIGSAFANKNGFRTIWYVTIARWACLPICVTGGYFCLRWASDMYGPVAGVVGLTLWCFCPNILGNGALITPDLGAAAFGVAAGYYFWRWLSEGNWKFVGLSGVALGVAVLSKFTWIILFGLWPMLWLNMRVGLRFSGLSSFRSQKTASTVPFACPIGSQKPSFSQLVAILLLALYLVNLGYCFEDSFQRLSDFSFISQALGGPEAHDTPSNRFDGLWLGDLRVPVPANYVRGIDVQRYDFERGKWSYLRGEVTKKGGWWYYYLYAMAVKIPTGTICLFGLLIVLRAVRSAQSKVAESNENAHDVRKDEARLTRFFAVVDELAVLAPAAIVIALVSSQTGFNRSVRYVLPAIPFLYVWVSQIGQFAWDSVVKRGRRTMWGFGVGLLAATSLVSSVVSSLAVYPHSLSYFNELIGGPLNGPSHLLDANIDWDQDLIYLKEWYDAHPEARPFHLTRYGFINSSVAGIESLPVPRMRSGDDMNRTIPLDDRIPSGWYAISVNELFGERSYEYEWLNEMNLVGRCGYSIWIFHGLRDSTDTVSTPSFRTRNLCQTSSVTKGALRGSVFGRCCGEHPQ